MKAIGLFGIGAFALGCATAAGMVLLPNTPTVVEVDLTTKVIVDSTIQGLPCGGLVEVTNPGPSDVGSVVILVHPMDAGDEVSADTVVLRNILTGRKGAERFYIPNARCRDEESIRLSILLAQDGDGDRLLVRNKGPVESVHHVAAPKEGAVIGHLVPESMSRQALPQHAPTDRPAPVIEALSGATLNGITAGSSSSKHVTPRQGATATDLVVDSKIKPPQATGESVFAKEARERETASFDCTAAQTPIENAICGNVDLRNADNEMATLYRNAFQDGKIDQQRQLNWLRIRDDSCLQDVALSDCLIRVTHRRIAYLRDVLAGTGWSITQNKGGRRFARGHADNMSIGVGCFESGSLAMLILSDGISREATNVEVRVDGKPALASEGRAYEQEGQAGFLVDVSGEQLAWLRRGTRAEVLVGGMSQGEVPLNGSDKAISASIEACDGGLSATRDTDVERNQKPNLNSDETNTGRKGQVLRERRSAPADESLKTGAGRAHHKAAQQPGPGPSAMTAARENPLLGSWSTGRGSVVTFTEDQMVLEDSDKTVKRFTLNTRGTYYMAEEVVYTVSGDMVTVADVSDFPDSEFTMKYRVRDTDRIEHTYYSAATVQNGQNTINEPKSLLRLPSHSLPGNYDVRDAYLVAYNAESIRVLSGVCSDAISDTLVVGARLVSARAMLSLGERDRNEIINGTAEMAGRMEQHGGGCLNKKVVRRMTIVTEATRAALAAYNRL